MTSNVEKVKHIWLVLSGKGGVGKSTVTVNLALTLVRKGYKVGVLDIDLTGPSIPRMFELDGRSVHQSANGWLPVYTDPSQSLGVMSIGFLLSNKDDAVVWRGPKKTAMIKQFIQDVAWGEIDYLLIDTPPGTSDEHISVVEYLKDARPDGAVVVTTPQMVSITDVKKEINFCKTVGMPILGLVENMSGFACPHCENCSNIFSKGGGEHLAKDLSIQFLGAIPINPQLTTLIETSESQQQQSSYQQKFHESATFPYFEAMIETLTATRK